MQEHELGRRASLEAVFHASYGDLVRLAFYIVNDWAVAEELVQEAFVRCCAGWARVRNPESALPYVRKAVVNLSRSAIHRWQLERRVRAADVVQGGIDVDGRLDLIAAVSRLPRRKREVVVLRYFADLSEAEAADVLGVSIGTVKSQCAKALRQLEQSLTEVD